MLRPLLCLLLSVVGSIGAPPVTAPVEPPAAGAALRLSGRWSGELRPAPGLAPLPWRVAAEARLGGGGTTAIAVAVETPGGPLQATGQSGETAGAATWQVPPQSLEASPLWDWLAPLQLLPPGLRPGGEVEARGAGTWSAASGAAGELLLVGTAATLEWPERDLHLAGPRIEATLRLAESVVVALEIRVGWDSGRIAAVRFGSGRLQAQRIDDGAWRLAEATVELWQGRVALAPLTFHPAAPAFAGMVTLEEVALAELAAFIPKALRAAAGHLSGRFELRWTPADGLRPGRGTLRVQGAEPARVQLAPAPGLLSARVPARLAVLPDWLGPLSAWTSVANPARSELQRIELGELPVQVEALQVDLYPDGEGGPLSARVQLKGKPERSNLVEQVVFTINVTGPLQELIELGLDERSRIETEKN